MVEQTARLARIRRHLRVRLKINGLTSRPRLSVFRSLNHIYAQLIDDSEGCTLVTASTVDLELRGKMNGQKKTAQAEMVGTLMAKRILDLGIKQIVFDRGGYKYHGRVKALAESIRQGGVNF